MIRQSDLGQMLAVLAISYTRPLFDWTFLDIEDQDFFQKHCREAVAKVDDARYNDNVVAWIVDWEGIARHFLASYRPTASERDVAALKWWYRNGYNGIHAPDLISDLWRSSLQWVRNNKEWHDDVTPTHREIILDFTRRLHNMRKSDEYSDMLDEIRDHTDNDQDLWVKVKLNLNFYDDLIDPLLNFTSMRGKLLLLEMSREHLDDPEFLTAINMIPELWVRYDGNKITVHDYAGLLPDSRIDTLEVV
jgi:hypothetical protein